MEIGEIAAKIKSLSGSLSWAMLVGAKLNKELDRNIASQKDFVERIAELQEAYKSQTGEYFQDFR